MRAMNSTVLMCVTGVLVLGAGGGGSGAANHSFTSMATAIDPSDQARAEAMVITSADLPAAWTSTPDDAERNRDARCVDGSGLTESGRAFSDVLARTDAGYDIHMQSQATVFESEDQARTWFARLRDDAVVACVRRAFNDEQKRDADAGIRFDVTGAGNLPVANVGDESTGIRLTIDVTGPAQTIPAYLDYIFVRVGDATSGMILFDVRQPFDETETMSGSPTTADLAAVLADRMESARRS
ncbi:MAG: hypothetical protein QOE17_1766 [Gaiellales bacterium]|nr:hypothetical protein [Gaiellales bacterium]